MTTTNNGNTSDELPGTKPTKAIIGTIVAGVLAFAAPIGVTLHANLPVTGVTWFDSTVAALVFAGAVYPSIYYPTNAPKL